MIVLELINEFKEVAGYKRPINKSQLYFYILPISISGIEITITVAQKIQNI